MIKHMMEQRSEAWFDVRLGRITGTGFASLMAAKTTAAYKNLIANVVAEIITREAETIDFTTADMQHGIDTEPEAAEYYSSLLGVKLYEVGFVTPDEDNKYSEWVGVSPDRLIQDGGILEIKCPKRSTHLYYIQSGKLPSTYKWQVYGQLYVMGAKYCDFMSYVKGLKPFIIRVYPNTEIFAEIEKELDIFVIKVKEMLKAYNNYNVL